MKIFLCVFGFLFFMDLSQLFTNLRDDRKKSNPIGYRYSNLPSDVNVLEIWAILIIGVGLQLSVKGLMCVFVAQAIISLHSLYILSGNRHPQWFDWI